ncbi:phosphoethanolamine--lipid A transferase [uncultured Aquitalea sp.]|uniref:phosphoethanolamine transferase n=1 Tax=uncultured Aquitalea sp. TaxID=540272 RepID=UPI0025CC90ED|nr:phosphoethanolamine--lipid A transferase [uncultured Aquitalea sp.]
MLPTFSIRPERLTLLVSLLLVVFYNVPFWREMLRIVGPLDSHGVKLLVESFFLVVAFYNLVLTLFTWPYLVKPVLAVLLVVTAFIAYFMNQYGVMIDTHMVQNAVQTDSREVRDLLTWKMALFGLLLGALPLALLWKARIVWRSPLKETGVRLLTLLVSAAVLFGIAFLAYQDFASLFRNNRQLRHYLTPFNYIQAVNGYYQDHYNSGPIVVGPYGEDAKRDPAWNAHKRKTVFVIVVGETARADHFQLNGYPRDNNPKLSAQQGLINLPNVHSCGTETAVSVPCMFSGMTRENYSGDKAARQENLLDILKRAGLNVVWRDNQSGCKDVCNRVTLEDMTVSKDDKLCVTGECWDEILLKNAQEVIDKSDKDVVLVLHQMGNHGPAYYKRYPPAFEKFKPVCQTSELSRCPKEQIVNGFDNAILYTDTVLSGVIDFLRANQQRFNTGMIYMSDHGESLGENGLYLHGTPYMLAPEAQKHVGAMMWFSDGFRQDVGLNQSCLEARKAQPYSHDNLFHSVLGLMGVQTAVYNKELDMFAACRR